MKYHGSEDDWFEALFQALKERAGDMWYTLSFEDRWIFTLLFLAGVLMAVVLVMGPRI